MKLHPLVVGTGLLSAASVSAATKGLPVDKVYGVNLGGWLLSEPWMFPNEWVNNMGGDRCDADCSSCAASEFGLVQKLGQEKADKAFAEHWATWFTEKDVDDIVDAGLNTVRIPLGYWIVESLVDRSNEYYPRGGMKYLKKGLGWLKKKGIHVMLDHHALPGVATPNQMFAGRCTGDVQFYTPKNYRRALIWAGVMTTLAHIDPDFSSVFSIEAINEPRMDANLTPGYGDYQKQFVKVVRAVEYALGIKCPDVDYTKLFSNSSHSNALDLGFLKVANHVVDPVVDDALKAVAVSVRDICRDLGIKISPNLRTIVRIECLLACLDRFPNKDWQYNNPPNPADAAIGPQVYDAHLYFSFGGVADPNAESYMRVICNSDRVKSAYEGNNKPLVFGEWSLATNFGASPEFLRDWADAQKFIYAGQADGWIFWSFKIEAGSPNLPNWSYFASLQAGYFTKDPSALNNPDVCKPWISNSTSTAA
ncbi:glycoside hydrolase family 5 protein [Rhizoctonia solani AG-3 Rhs1AP]|uniref:Glycoside hydrolase family 5 protein n=2 Tax=Rhizoctonia solani AG-3 TaxID=1086053 RepID=A0A074RPR9_9AGAM|nr:glycoside hydrolase family 5 protein [Rhizoctonia solani AG-3 Rhs1AP]KEP49061.1 glycoside hydrolase family 5 protein [Rhizoctonia solani 123E]